MEERKHANLETPSVYNVGPKPHASLVAFTPDPLFVVWYAWKYSREQDFLSGNTEDAIEMANSRFRPSRETLVKFFRQAITEWAPITEMIHFTFACSNIPRALMDQMTRHRLWSFFVQSMRVANMGTFADQQDYFVPDAITEAGAEAERTYAASMKLAQTSYQDLLARGVPIEDARGVLPLHTNTRMIIGANMRAFQQAVSKRTCWILQQQYWAPLLVSMRYQLVRKVDPEMALLFKMPCADGGKCLTWIEQQYRLEGQDPNPPCPYHAKLGKREAT